VERIPSSALDPMTHIFGRLFALTNVNDRSAKYEYRTCFNTLAISFFSMILLLAASSEAQEVKSDSSAAQLLQPGQAIENQLAANAKQSFYLTVEPGNTIVVSILQQSGSASVKCTTPVGVTGAPRTNDAGQMSKIRFTLVGQAAGRYRFDIAGYRATETAKYSLTLSPLHASTEKDGKASEAEELLAQAEWSRRKDNRDSWPRALEEYDRAAEFFRSQDDPVFARAALVGKARLLIFKLNQYPAGEKTASEAVVVDSGKDDLPGQGLAWKTLGSAHYFLGNYSDSIEAAQKALAFYRDTADYYWEGIILGNLAYTEREIGETTAALEHATQALTIARQINDSFGVVFNLEALATIHLSRGELEPAFQLYHQALDETKVHPYPAEEAAIWNGLGDLYAELDDSTRAMESFRKSITIAEQASDTAGSLKALSSLADQELNHGHAQEALLDYRRGLDKAITLGLVREQSLLLTGLAMAHAAERENSLAQENFDKAVATARRIGHKESESRALLALGDFQFSKGQPKEASVSYERALQLSGEESNRGRSAIALASLARISFETGDLAKARQQIDDALKLIDSCRGTLESRDLRTSYFASKRSYYDMAIAVLMRLHQQNPNAGNDVIAFQMAERARSRTLLDEITHDDPPSFITVSSELFAKRQDNQKRLRILYQRIRELSQDTSATEAQFAAIQSAIEKLLSAGDELDAQVRASSPDYSKFTGAVPATLSEVQSALPDPRTGLAEYWIGTKESYLWMITSSGLRATVLPGRSTVEELVQNWSKELLARSESPAGESLEARQSRISRSDANEHDLAQRLGHLLIGPILKSSSLHRLYLVPDGPLFSVPFPALRLSTRDSTNTQSPHFLISRFEISQEPSASVLLALMRSNKSQDHELRTVVFADPVYTANDPRVIGQSSKALGNKHDTSVERWATEASMTHLPRLEASRQEAMTIAGLGDKQNTLLRLDFDASLDAFRNLDWKNISVAHFAVHALMDTSHPAFSGLVFSMVGPSGTGRDGVLWLNDIYSFHLPLNLVVLSGCRTANGHEVPSEGITGLARAFLFSGAKQVIGSLWSVEDNRTSLLMQGFYTNYRRNHSPSAQALRAAQMQLAASPETSAPYYWAGFTIQGAP
jgi:CHAT domain-containing protein/Tfp pilus assembly protein PilF